VATLILMRHAEAQAAATGMRDFDRALSAAGRREAAAAAARMRASGVSVDLLLHSAARRTTETASLVAAGLELDTGRLRAEPRLYNASVAIIQDAALEALRDLRDAATVLLVAHNPGISDYSALLAGPKVRAARASMATGEFRLYSMQDL
jgi:phosphohistidine phosphatase